MAGGGAGRALGTGAANQRRSAHQGRASSYVRGTWQLLADRQGDHREGLSGPNPGPGIL